MTEHCMIVIYTSLIICFIHGHSMVDLPDMPDSLSWTKVKGLSRHWAGCDGFPHEMMITTTISSRESVLLRRSNCEYAAACRCEWWGEMNNSRHRWHNVSESIANMSICVDFLSERSQLKWPFTLFSLFCVDVHYDCFVLCIWKLFIAQL